MLYESVDAMKRTNKVNLIGGTFTLAMTLAVASVGQKAWADDMTQAAPATEIAPATNGADVLELQAIFMDVQGKVRWRKSEDSAWTEAKVNDLLSAGAEIRTGLKSRSTLRVGKNATILVDSGTTFKLPEIVQDGQTLRTLATVKSGRADFKVDHVGFANDFKVVTPQTTLSVRGTGFALASGPLKGVDVAGANTNTINAIEVKYIAANLSYFVSGQGQTSSESGKQDPVQNAWASTIGPPPIAGTYTSQSDVEQQVAQGVSGANPSSNTQQIQQTQASEANAAAVDTALVLASDTTGGGEESGSGYSLYQSEAQSTEQGLSLLNADAQTNQGLSNSDLERFNNNFRVYETGQWTQSLLDLNTLWNGSDSAGKGDGFTYGFTSDIGARAMLDNLKNSSAADLLTSDTKLNSISFDPSRYFNNEDSSDAKHNYGDAVISTAAFTDGALLNGATNSLWSLSESARTNLGMAVGLNSSVQTAFQSVQDSYGHLQVAQLALDGLSTGSAFSVEYTTTFTNQFANLNKFLSNLKNLIGASTSAQSQDAYAQLAGVVNSAAVHVELGLAAAKTARDNYNNASSRATQELFQAEELKYLDAVRIRLESIAYLTKERKNPDGSAAPDGPDGIKELAEQIMQNFHVANNQFAWGSFSDYARPQVVAAGIDSGAIVALARLSGDDSTAALEQLKNDSTNKSEIDGQLYIMTQQVGFMQSKFGIADSQGNYAVGTLMGFHSQSVIDVESSNVFKGQFDQLFADGKFQSELDSDLNGLRDLNSLYTGDQSIQQKAGTTLEQISGHHDNVDNANLAIHGLTASYETHLANAISNAGASSTTFNERFTNSQATATKYLQDFTTIVGANTTKVATDALAAVATLVGEHNQYVKNASDAVGAARDAAVAAGTRGQQVYMGAVAQRMGEAATIQSAANLAMLEVVTNGSAIQQNYSQAQADYDTRSLPPSN